MGSKNSSSVKLVYGCNLKKKEKRGSRGPWVAQLDKPRI